MQKIPSLYGFSIITLVLALMVINHFVYLRILENSIAESQPPNVEETSEPSLNGEDQADEDSTSEDTTSNGVQDALDESSVNSDTETSVDRPVTDEEE